MKRDVSLFSVAVLVMITSCTSSEDEIIPPQKTPPSLGTGSEEIINETQVMLVSPANGSADGIAPTLEWNALPGVSAYTVAASKDSTCLKFDEWIPEECNIDLWILAHPTNTRSMDQYGAGLYYWRVAAYDHYTGRQTGWSKIQSFTIHAPNTLSPNNNTENTERNVTLQWEAFPAANSYNLIINGPKNETEMIRDITTTSYTLSDLALTTAYTWRVSANIDKGTTGYSDPRNFFTTGYIANAGLVSWIPFNGGVYDECAYGQLWGGSVPGTLDGALLSEDRFGKSNSSYSFDRTDQIKVTGIVQLYDLDGSYYDTDYTLPHGNAKRSVSLWFASHPTNEQSQIFKWGNDQLNEAFGFGLNAGVPQFFDNGENPQGIGFFSDNKWHNVIITYDGTTVAVHVDGELNMSNTKTELNTSKSELRIGDSFIGKIDDISIYDRVLSAEEIKFIASKK